MVRFGVLGPLLVTGIDGRSRPLHPRQARLLAVLLLAANRTVTRQQLIDALWDDRPPATAVRQIQNTISSLRQWLPGVLLTDGPGYRIQIEEGQLDAHTFATEVARAQELASGGGAAEATQHLRQALALWRGPAIAGCPGRTIQAAGARLDEQRLTATEQCIDLELKLCRHRDVVGELTELVATHPLRERLVEQLMLALYRSGRRADALAAYHEHRLRLAEDLGLDPGPGLQHLHIQILQGRTSPPAPNTGPTPVPRQLPPAVAHFVGRAHHVAELDSLLAGEGAPTTVVITAIAGTAGVGKTALAVHWAHRMADRFPDGQLYMNLRGFDPSGLPVDPDTAVRWMLDALGVPPDRIPADPQAQTALYRSTLAGRRVLVLLDNARDAAHVRPLLPGVRGSMAVVTSRSTLTGLVATEGATSLTLDLLSTVEANELLARRLGRRRVAAEPAAAAALIAGCVRLPLALAIVAAWAATRPHLSLSAVAAELDDGLAELGTDDVGSTLQAVFSWSYQCLRTPAARLFRLFGLHAGPDIGVTAAASLAGVTDRAVRHLLAELTRATLLTEHAAGRYTTHDLLRAYAVAQATRIDSQQERSAAIRRVLDHYLHTAHAADARLDPTRRRLTLPELTPGTIRGSIVDGDTAMTWFGTEHAVLLTAINLAVQSGHDAHAWQLAWTLSTYQTRQGYWRDRITTQIMAVAATQRLGDQRGQARSHNGLGLAYTAVDQLDHAHDQFTRALDLHRRLADYTGQARVQLNLGHVAERRQSFADALDHARLALDLARTADDLGGQADALNNIGWYFAHLGRPHDALTHCHQALAVQQRTGDRHGQADAWDSIGYAHHLLGQFEQALDAYHTALDLYRATRDRHNQADVLVDLGDVHRDSSELPAARQAWRQALAILDQLGHPDSARIRTKLEALSRRASVR